MAKMENEQFQTDRADNLRKEFDAKIDKLDAKIDQKISNHVIYWITPLFMTIAIGICAYAISEINKVGDKIDQVKDRITRIEVKMENKK